MTDFTAPNTGNYVVGKGSAYFTPEGGTRRHLGNAAVFEMELEVEELEHFSSQTGVRTKDLVVVLEKSGAITMSLEEWTRENVQMALMGGDIEEDTEGNATFEIMANNLTRGRLEFISNNDVGPKWTYDFPSVAFRPNGPIAGITSEWGALELSGEIEAVSGVFGHATLQNSTVPTE